MSKKMAKKTFIVGLKSTTDVELNLLLNVFDIMTALMSNTEVWFSELANDRSVASEFADFVRDSPDNFDQVTFWLAATFSGMTVDPQIYRILTDCTLDPNDVYDLPASWKKKLNSSFKKVVLPAMRSWFNEKEKARLEHEQAGIAAEEKKLIAQVRALGYTVTPINKKK